MLIAEKEHTGRRRVSAVFSRTLFGFFLVVIGLLSLSAVPQQAQANPCPGLPNNGDEVQIDLDTEVCAATVGGFDIQIGNVIPDGDGIIVDVNSGVTTINFVPAVTPIPLSSFTYVVPCAVMTACNISASGVGDGGEAFSFDLVSPGTDNTLTVENLSFTASGPDIDFQRPASTSIADAGTDAQGAQTAGTEVTLTYTIENTGTSLLTITGTPTATPTTNVTIGTITAPGDLTLTPGQTTTFNVPYTPTNAGAFAFELDILSDDPDAESTYDITVSGTGSPLATGLAATSGSGQTAEVNTAFGAVLVATVTDGGGTGVGGVNVTFTAPATGPSLTFASTGTNTETVVSAGDGTATSSEMTANASVSAFSGGSLEPYTVVASSAGLPNANFSLTNGRDANADIQKTKEAIARFVTNRANNIVSQQPDFLSRLTNGRFGRQSGANGFNFEVTPSSQSGSFEFSLRAFTNQLRRSVNGGDRPSGQADRPQPAGDRFAMFDNFKSTSALGYTTEAPPVGGGDMFGVLNVAGGDAGTADPGPQSGWDFWAQGTYAITDSGNAETQTGFLFAGLDYRFKDRAVAGLVGQLDITDESNDTDNTSADGVGWMAGPYAVLRVRDNFYFDGAATYGQSYNTLNALGLFEDDFRTQRFLLQGGLTGDFEVTSNTRVSPFARVTYYFETQESYTDTLGRLIPSQDFDLGRLEFGPKVAWDLVLDDRLLFSPFLSLSGIYDFNKLNDATPADATLASSDEDLRARLKAGAGLVLPGRGIRFSGEGFFDGIGTEDFRSYGATVNVVIPF